MRDNNYTFDNHSREREIELEQKVLKAVREYIEFVDVPRVKVAAWKNVTGIHIALEHK